MINAPGIKINPQINQSTTKEVQKTQTPKIETPQKEIRVSSEYAIAALGINKVPVGLKKQTTDSVKQFINDLPFAKKISPEDKRSLGTILKKNDKETDYMNKMINLISEEKVNPYALSHLCSHGQMSDLVKEDIDIYFDKVQNQKMSIEDAFVPLHGTQIEGQKAVNVGDVFRVDGQDKIYIKSGDDYSRQLDMDAKTYVKLFPPVERYASSQGEAGDCYLLSSINSIMENPYARAAIYDCFSQKENAVSAQFYNGTAKILCPDCKLPESVNPRQYADGATGIKILEHLYGVDFEEQKINEYSKVMTEEFDKLGKELEKWKNKQPQDNLALKKQKEITKKIENYQKGQQQVQEALKDPNHKLTFVLDDDDDFLMGKFGPMFEDCDKLHPDFKHPCDYYRGSNGGYLDTALSRLGFPAESYNVDSEEDEEELDDILFSEDVNECIITARTPYSEAGVESPIEEEYSIVSSHAYKVQPFDDENGDRMFKVTNPWNQSHVVLMDESLLKEYFSTFATSKVK